MDEVDTPDEKLARQRVFQQFSKLAAIREERIRKRAETETETRPADPNKTSYYMPWMSDRDKAKFDAEQMEYTQSLKDRFKPRVGQEKEIPSGVLDPRQDDDNSSAGLMAFAKPTNIVAQLNSLRGRTRRIGGKTRPPAAPASTCDFEVTSTIMPPTEVNVTSGEFQSNVCTQELRRLYFNGYKHNKTLPIYNQRNHIINSINSYGVIIIEGATGCGKTTQVPIYILEDAILERPGAKAPVIYVTQPRKIAARSISERVCQEHDWNLGTLVGYQVGLEKVVGPHTVLVFCTAGVLLQKIIHEKSLTNYTHIIIDEVHERDADTDLLLMMIKTLMHKEMPVFRLIIMSATMDTDKLRNYFSFKTNFGQQYMTSPASIVIGQDRAMSQISLIYFDKLKQLFNIDEELNDLDIDHPEICEASYRAGVRIIIDVIPQLDTFNENSKSTLVFLPGLAEISKLHRMLLERVDQADKIDILPLHSCLTSSDQNKVFKPSPAKRRKVILATNIAESSITVSDVGFVVDYCLMKSMRKDTISRFPILKLQWSTKDKSTQRAGRTGRCCPGKVFRMVPSYFYSEFADFAEPELLTTPLELSVLRVKNFQMGEVFELLGIVMDPPPKIEIRTAVLELKQIGALSSTYKGELSSIDGDLTELGRVISALPIDVHLGKLIVLGSVFDILDDTIVIAACLSTNRNVVSFIYGEEERTYDNKIMWARGSSSDLVVNLDVYNEFKRYKDQNKDDNFLARWCRKRNLDEKKLYEVDAQIIDIRNRLEQVNITQFEQPNRNRDVNEDFLMLKIAFCAAFYPSYFLSQSPDVKEVKKELCGLDPTRTVILSNFAINQVPLYMTQISNQIKEKVCDKFDYIADCSRALLVLHDDEEMQRDSSVMDTVGEIVIEPSKRIPRCVYKAIKFGDAHSSKRIRIREFKDLVAHERMEYYWHQKDTLIKALHGRLVPSWMKIVADRAADNSKMLEANDDEYTELCLDNYLIEVDLNREQDAADMQDLEELETYERSYAGGRELEHSLFRPVHIEIRGPFSPIRMKFVPVLTKSRGYSLEIDQQSVNSILLDPDYEKDRRQMLVAASVMQSKNGKIMARDTTLMPNIRGLPTLMALLFAQYYKIVYNTEMECIAGGTFGIGWTQQDAPLDDSYEVNLGFDVHITPDDIDLINKARQKISELLRFTEVQNVGQPKALLQRQLRDILLTLLRKRRYAINETDISYINSNEGSMLIRDKHNIPGEQTTVLREGQTRPFLPLVEMTRNYSEIALYQAVRRNLKYLDNIENGTIEKMPREGVRCYLCGNGQFNDNYFMFHVKLVEHLYSESHVTKLEEFEKFEERAASRLSSDH